MDTIVTRTDSLNVCVTLTAPKDKPFPVGTFTKTTNNAPKVVDVNDVSAIGAPAETLKLGCAVKAPGKAAVLVTVHYADGRTEVGTPKTIIVEPFTTEWTVVSA